MFNIFGVCGSIATRILFSVATLAPLSVTPTLAQDGDAPATVTSEPSDPAKTTFYATFEVPPKSDATSNGVTIFNPDEERTLTVSLRCLEEADIGDIKLAGSTKFFRFNVENVTRDCPGFEIDAAFKDDIKKTRAYRAAIPIGETSGQVTTDPAVFVFNSVTGNWAEAQGGGKPTEPGKAFATLTEKYSKVIVGVISYPDILSHDPTSHSPKALLASVDKLDPTAGYQRISAPVGNAQGSTTLDFPLMLRPVRGPKPELTISYSSAAGIGLLGQGWDMSVPSISVETVSAPFYETLETEDYMFRGHLMFPWDEVSKTYATPNKRGGVLHARKGGVREFRLRDVGSGVSIRRHGDAPDNYRWEVYDPHSGQTSLFGAQKTTEPGFVPAVDLGAVERGKGRAISRWMMTQVYDNQRANNQTIYRYLPVCTTNPASGKAPEDCRADAHVPVVKSVSYNGAMKAEVVAVSASGNSTPSWEGGITTILAHYRPREEPRREITHGRFGKIISNRRWLENVEVRYGSDAEYGEGTLFSRYTFHLDEGRDPTLNFKHHLMRVELEANDELFKEPEPVLAEWKNGKRYSAKLKKQVFQFDYHRSEVESVWESGKPLAKQSQPGYPAGSWDPCELVIKRPRILEDIFGCESSAGQVTSPAFLGTTLSSEKGGSVHLGIGPAGDVQSKIPTAGVKFSSTSSESLGLSSIVDIDGDGLVDFVFKSGSGLMYCPGERERSSVYSLASFKPNYQPGELLKTTFSNRCWPIQGPNSDRGAPSDFSKSESDTTSISPEVHLAEGSLTGLNFSKTKNRTKTYFSDVDADGLIDIVDATTVYYNLGREGMDGKYLLRFEQGKPLIPPMPAEGLRKAVSVSDLKPPFLKSQLDEIQGDLKALESELEKFPELEPILVWRAPTAGYVSISGKISVSGKTIDRKVEIFRERVTNGALLETDVVECIEPADLQPNPSSLNLSNLDINDDCNPAPESFTNFYPEYRFAPVEIARWEEIVASGRVVRVEENDVLSFTVSAGDYNKTDQVVHDIKVSYSLTDWDENINSLDDSITLAGVKSISELKLIAPAIGFDVNSDISPQSGLKRYATLPGSAKSARFMAHFSFDGDLPQLELRTKFAAGSGALIRISSLHPGFQCWSPVHIDKHVICDFEVDSAHLLQDSVFEIVLVEDSRKAISKLYWKTPPRLVVELPEPEMFDPVKRAAFLKETTERIEDLKEKLNTAPASEQAKIKAEIEIAEGRLAVAESSAPPEIKSAFSKPDILVPVPVNDPRLARRPQRVSHLVIERGSNLLKSDDVLQIEISKKESEIRAENEALIRLCKNHDLIRNEISSALSETPPEVPDSCDSIGLPSVADDILDPSGETAESLYAWADEIQRTLNKSKSLFYDNSFVTPTGFRLPVRVNPSECNSRTYCEISFRPNIPDIQMLKPFSFEVSMRLFVNGSLKQFSANGRSKTEVATFVIEHKKQHRMKIEGGLVPIPSFSFEAKPGDLIYFEMASDAIDAQMLALTNTVFRNAEIALDTAAAGESGYLSYSCSSNREFCPRTDRLAFDLQFPIHLNEQPASVRQDIALNGRLDERQERLPDFTVDAGNWGIYYRLNPGGTAAPIRLNEAQFLDLSRLPDLAQQARCQDNIEKFEPDLSKEMGDVPECQKLEQLLGDREIFAPKSTWHIRPAAAALKFSLYPVLQESLERKPSETDWRWSWSYMLEETDLIAWSGSHNSISGLRIGFGRFGPDVELIRRIEELGQLIKKLEKIDGKQVNQPVVSDGSIYRSRGRPSAGGGEFLPLFGPIQGSKSRSMSKTFGAGPASATLVLSDRTTTANFLDVNGDGFPEFVDEAGKGTMSSPVGVPRSIWTKAFLAKGASNAATGGEFEPHFGQAGAARSATLGLGVAPPTAGQFLTRLVNSLTSGAVEGNFSLSVNGSFGGGFNTRNIAFADFNGDGLIDPYTEKTINDPFEVKLNAGGNASSAGGFVDAAVGTAVGNPSLPSFPQSEFERFGTNSSSGLGLNLGFAMNNNSMSAGVGTGMRASGSYFSFMDFTADGRVDIVYPVDGGLVVIPNLGNGFDKQFAKFHSIPEFQFIQSSASESVYTDVGGNVTGGVNVLAIKVTLTIGVKDAESYSRSLLQIRDFNADGVPDVAQERSLFQGLKPLGSGFGIVKEYVTGIPKIGGPTGDVTVHYNPEGRVGLLKSVTQPTGSRMRLDYALIGNTGPDHGRAVWSLARVDTEDTYKPKAPMLVSSGVGEFAVDGHDIARQMYRYSSGHFNRAEKAFYGFAAMVRDDFGINCDDTDCGKSDELRRTTQYFDTSTYFSKGSVVEHVIADPDPLEEITSRKDHDQIISVSSEGYSVYDFAAVKKSFWQSSSGRDPPKLNVREEGIALPDRTLLDRLTEFGTPSASGVAARAVIKLNEDLQKLEIHEYANGFESYLGANRARISLLKIYGDDQRWKIRYPSRRKKRLLDYDARGPGGFVSSAVGYDPDRWGQPTTFYDIGRIGLGDVQSASAGSSGCAACKSRGIGDRDIDNSLRGEVGYADLNVVFANQLGATPAFRRPLLGRSASIRVTRGLPHREVETAADDYLRGRQALYEDSTGNLNDICLFGRDVRESMCSDYVGELSGSEEGDIQARVRFAENSITVAPSDIIHAKVSAYDEFGNPTETLSPLNNSGEWIERNFEYRGDPFRLSATRIELTRCVRPEVHGKSSYGEDISSHCWYGGNIPVSKSYNSAISHRSFRSIDGHFGTVAVSRDINNNSLLTEVDRWGRPGLVARSFGGGNVGSASQAQRLRAAADRHGVNSIPWFPILEVEYIGAERKQLNPPTDSVIVALSPANDSLYRARVAKFVEGEFYRGLSLRPHSQGAVYSHVLSDGEGKTVQQFRESEVCVLSGFEEAVVREKAEKAKRDREAGFTSITKQLDDIKNISTGSAEKQSDNVSKLINDAEISNQNKYFFKKLQQNNFLRSAAPVPATPLNELALIFDAASGFATEFSRTEDLPLSDADRDYSKVALTADLCAKWQAMVVQPAPAKDALGREVAKFEAFSADPIEGFAPNSRPDDEKHGLDLRVVPIGPSQGITLFPVESSIYDAADRPIIAMQRLGRLKLHRPVATTPAGLMDAMHAATQTMNKTDVRNSKTGFVETTQMSYRVSNSFHDQGPVFAALTMTPRCTLQRTSFDARGLTMRVSQEHGEDAFHSQTGKIADPASYEQPDLGKHLGGFSNLSSRPAGYDLTACERIDPDFRWTSEASDTSPQAVAYRYDALRQLRRVILPRPSKELPSLGEINVRYDDFGRRIALDDVNTGVSEYTYDDMNNVVGERSSRPDGAAETIKDYFYAANRLIRVEYQSGREQQDTSGFRREEDAADAVHFFYDTYPDDISDLLTDDDARAWFSAEMSSASCSDCIGKVVAVKDRSGLKASRYNPLGQELETFRSIVHPESRLSTVNVKDIEIGRFLQRNQYTSFGDLIDTQVKDMKPSEPSPKCLRNDAYVCGGTFNLGYRHTPDGKIASITFANSNQKILQTAYDALARPFLSLTGDRTHTHSNFDPIDFRLNGAKARTAIGAWVQNTSFAYERGGNVRFYRNALDGLKIGGSKEHLSLSHHYSKFEFNYDAPNRLTSMRWWNKAAPAPLTGSDPFAIGAYDYDDAHRFLNRELTIGAATRKWTYNYPETARSLPRHAPQTIGFSWAAVAGLGPDDLPSVVTSTRFDGLGRLSAITNREVSKNAGAVVEPLTQRQLVWDAEDRLRRVDNSVPTPSRPDSDPTRTSFFPPHCKNAINRKKPECTNPLSPEMPPRIGDLYTYDFGSNRVVKKSISPNGDPAMTLYVTPFYARGYESRGTVQVSQNGRPVASIDVPYNDSNAQPGVNYLFSDLAVGSLSASVRTPGEAGLDLPVIARREYSPFGMSLTDASIAMLGPKSQTSAQSALYSFHGKELDGSTGFSSFGARFYARDLGLWLSADPYLSSEQFNNLAKADPGSWSSYAFNRQNPILHNDSDGRNPLGACLIWVPCSASISAAAKTTFTYIASGLAAGAGGYVAGQKLADALETASKPQAQSKSQSTTISISQSKSKNRDNKNILYHYTDDEGLAGILATQSLKPSLKSRNPKDARIGDGQYVSDIMPGTKTNNQLSRVFINNPFQGKKFKNFIAINVKGLPLIKGRDGVYLIPNSSSLSIFGRIEAIGVNEVD